MEPFGVAASSSSQRPHPPPPKSLLFRYSIDVLSNGTEYAGCPGQNSEVSLPALFLSIWKVTNRNDHDDSDDEDYEGGGGGLLLARYGLVGVGSCDGLARIAADQQYKLGPVRALFGMTDRTDRNHPDVLNSSSLLLTEVASLPSILYACQQETLSLVIPNPNLLDRIERLVQLVHGNHAYPKVRLCSIPDICQQCPSIETPMHHRHQQQSRPQWWKVYDDDHMVVHAAKWHPARTGIIDHDANGNDPEYDTVQIVYLMTFHRLVQQQYAKTKSRIPGPDSLLLLFAAPENTLDHQETSSWNLPVIDITNDDGETVMDHPTSVLRTVVVTNAASGVVVANERTDTTTPCTILIHPGTAGTDDDPDLLVRGRQQSLRWRQHCDASLLKHFPYQSNVPCRMDHHQGTVEACRSEKTKLTSSVVCHSNSALLRTGTSIMMEVHMNALSSSFSALTSMRIVDRNMSRERRQRKKEIRIDDGDDQSIVESRSVWPVKLKSFLSHQGTSTATAQRCNNNIGNYDENEIDLDAIDDCNENDHSTDCSEQQLPQLLVLGTGCASPSPYRSASGYVFVLPNPSPRASDPFPSPMLIAVEVGESYCTQFRRYGVGRSLAEIKLIWISHAHWDHYGGLVNLLLQIHQMNGATGIERNSWSIVEPQPKRVKQNSAISAPYVVAPPKVLRFLRLIFDHPGPYYTEVQMDDTAAMDNALQHLNKMNRCLPVLRWDNVRVDHSCLSYGFVLVLQMWERREPFIFVFSGDTRPCRNLVDQCRSLTKHYKSNNRVDFLLHEATFDEKEIHMSFTKKHSTVAEAIMVGRDIDAERLLLTHFSQRYDSVPNVDIESTRFEGRMNVGFALDGMKVFL